MLPSNIIIRSRSGDVQYRSGRSQVEEEAAEVGLRGVRPQDEVGGLGRKEHRPQQSRNQAVEVSPSSNRLGRCS